MNCNHCGEPVPEGSVFCTNCGAAMAYTPDVTPVPGKPKKKRKKLSKKRKKTPQAYLKD